MHLILAIKKSLKELQLSFFLIKYRFRRFFIAFSGNTIDYLSTRIKALTTI